MTGTAPSPSSDSAMFENGSGDAFADARVVSLAAWLVAASVPPISAAAVTQLAWSPPNTAAASAAPAGMRTNVWIASQTLSRPGFLSTKNSSRSISPLAPRTIGVARMWRSPGSWTQPSRPARPVRKTTAYRRSPLAQPSAAAIATSCVRSSCMSRLLPRGLAFVEKALDAFAAFGTDADVGDPPRRLGAQLRIDLAAGDVADELLARARRERRVGDDRIDDPAHDRVDRVGGADLVREAARLRLGGAEALGGDEPAPRRLLAHRADDVRADRRRQEAEPCLAEREGDALGDDADVAHRGDAQAAGVAVAVDARDHRHRAAVERPQHLGQTRRVGVVLLPRERRRLAHRAEIGAGAERLAAAADDDRAHAVVGGERSERRRQLADQRGVEGVPDLGAVEPDARHRA